MNKSTTIYFLLLIIQPFLWLDLAGQSLHFGANLQVYSSSPNRMYKEQFIPNILDKAEYTTDITYSSVPSYAIGVSFRKTIKENWGIYFNTSYEWLHLKFTNKIRPIHESEAFKINQEYRLQYITPNVMIAYFFRNHRKTSPYLKIGSASHYLFNQKYSSAPYVASPSDFNSNFVSLMCEFGSQIVLQNKQVVELAFLIDLDINGFEGNRNTKSRLYPNTSTLFSAGLRVHYFPFN